MLPCQLSERRQFPRRSLVESRKRSDLCCPETKSLSLSAELATSGSARRRATLGNARLRRCRDDEQLADNCRCRPPRRQAKDAVPIRAVSLPLDARSHPGNGTARSKGRGFGLDSGDFQHGPDHACLLDLQTKRGRADRPELAYQSGCRCRSSACGRPHLSTHTS